MKPFLFFCFRLAENLCQKEKIKVKVDKMGEL